jgi:hypothetical protein
MVSVVTWWLVAPALAALGAGDLAFVGYNADGEDDFAIVLLTDVVAETVYFTDKEPDGAGGLTTGEGFVRWDSGPELIPAGTVVVFTDIVGAERVSHGAISLPNALFNLAADGDGILAYQGASHTTPATFLAGMESGAGALGDLTGTGLNWGYTASSVSAGAHDDGAVFSGPRVIGTDWPSFLPRIHNAGWWTTANSDGETLLPFDTTAFLANAPHAVPLLGGWGLVALGAGLAGAGVRTLREPG